MSDESSSTTADVINAVAAVAKEVPIYPDMVQPAAQELGKGLLTVAKTVNLALAPLAGVVWGFDKIKEKFFPKVEERLRNVPRENIITPRISVAGPIVEALRYAGSEEALSDLYANLLATSMDRVTASTAHPAFTEIIKQLTPDEAKILKCFTSNQPMPLIDIKKFSKSDKVSGGYLLKYVNHSNLGSTAGCEHLDLVPAYIDNLVRLGLAEIPSGQCYKLDVIYRSLEDSELAISIKAEIERNPEDGCEFERKFLAVTSLGRQFAKVCVASKS